MRVLKSVVVQSNCCRHKGLAVPSGSNGRGKKPEGSIISWLW